MLKKLITILLFASSTTIAQNSIEVYSVSTTKLEAKSFPKLKTPSKHRYDEYYTNKIEEFYERRKAVEKKYKKMARLMKKPQYSDPSYFGHKRKPKKRALGKRKFCKECEIVH